MFYESKKGETFNNNTMKKVESKHLNQINDVKLTNVYIDTDIDIDE